MSASSLGFRFRPTLSPLEARDVPAAALDLTSAGSFGEINGALFQQTSAPSSETGVLNSFVRLQNTGVERGYNTDARPLQFNENSDRLATHSLRLNDVPVVIVNGVAYRQFVLEINQKASSPRLSLDELQIFLGDRGNLTGYKAGQGTLGGLHAIYDLDAVKNHSVVMNDSLNKNKDSADVIVLIPDRLFAASSDNPFVYLYSKFGQKGSANGGFEEWAVLPKSVAPPPVSSSLTGQVYVDLNRNGIFDEGETGIEGVSIGLTGTDDLGNQVVLTAVTNANGTYTFAGLRAGTYTITESQPVAYFDAEDSVGTLGGVLGQDRVANIQVKAGQQGLGYNFGEVVTLG